MSWTAAWRLERERHWPPNLLGWLNSPNPLYSHCRSLVERRISGYSVYAFAVNRTEELQVVPVEQRPALPVRSGHCSESVRILVALSSQSYNPLKKGPKSANAAPTAGPQSADSRDASRRMVSERRLQAIAADHRLMTRGRRASSGKSRTAAAKNHGCHCFSKLG